MKEIISSSIIRWFMIKFVKHYQTRDSIGGNLSCAASGVDIENKDFAPFLPFQLDRSQSFPISYLSQAGSTTFQLIFYFLSSAIEFIVITSVIVPYRRCHFKREHIWRWYHICFRFSDIPFSKLGINMCQTMQDIFSKPQYLD